MPARTINALLVSGVLAVGVNTPSALAGECPYQLGDLATGVGPGDVVEGIGTYDNGETSLLIIGGVLTSAGGVAVNNIASWNGEAWSAMGSGVNASPRAMLTWDDGTGPALYVGGDFTTAGGIPAAGIARWDGFAWSTLGSGMNATVWALKIFDDGSGPALFAAGKFSTAGGQPAAGIARWDGQQWSALGEGLSGIGLGFMDLELYDDGTGPALYVGGRFTTAGGQPANNIAKWDGSSWSTLGSGITDATNFLSVTTLATHDEGSGPQLYVGGRFSNAGGVAATNVAKWNGASWSAVGDFSPNSFVYALNSFDSGSSPARLIATAANSLRTITVLSGNSFVPINGIAQNETATHIHSHDDGSGPAIYFGGFFFNQNFGGLVLNHIAKWYRPCLATTVILVQPQSELLPPSGADAQFSISATGFALSYEWTRDGVLIEDGGPFGGATTALLTVAAASPELTTGFYRCRVINGVGSSTLSNRVSLSRRPSCPGDTNFDGVVNLTDLNIILSRFGTVCP